MTTISTLAAMASFHALSFVFGHVDIDQETHWIREVRIDDLGDDRVRVVIVIAEYNKEGATILPDIIISDVLHRDGDVLYDGKHYLRESNYPERWLLDSEHDEPVAAAT